MMLQSEDDSFPFKGTSIFRDEINVITQGPGYSSTITPSFCLRLWGSKRIEFLQKHLLAVPGGPNTSAKKTTGDRDPKKKGVHIKKKSQTHNSLKTGNQIGSSGNYGNLSCFFEFKGFI